MSVCVGIYRLYFKNISTERSRFRGQCIRLQAHKAFVLNWARWCSNWCHRCHFPLRSNLQWIFCCCFCFRTANQTLDKFNLRPLLPFLSFNLANFYFYFEHCSSPLRSILHSVCAWIVLCTMVLSNWFERNKIRFLSVFSTDWKTTHSLRSFRAHIHVVIDDLPIVPCKELRRVVCVIEMFLFVLLFTCMCVCACMQHLLKVLF